MKKLITVQTDMIRAHEYLDTEKYSITDIFEIVENRSRFNEVNELNQKLSKIPYDIFSSMFTPHFFINAENLNDAYLAMLAIYHTISEVTSDHYETLITTEIPHEATMFSNNRFNPWVQDCDLGDPLTDQEKEILERLKGNSTPIMHVHKMLSYGFGIQSCFENVDPDGKRLLFYLNVKEQDNMFNDTWLSEEERMTNNKECAESMNFVYVCCGKDNEEEKSEMLRNCLIDMGFDVSKVEDKLSELSKCQENINEYTVQAHMKSILNVHLLNDPSSMVLTKDDFIKINNNNLVKKAEKTTTSHRIVGLKKEREKIDGIVKMISLENKRKEMQLSNICNGCNMVFAGAPGTAKTTLAREFATQLAKHGHIQSAANFKECKKSDIVGAYVGWTAKQVDEMFSMMARSGGGVIFFDEIYTLSEKESTCFDSEAITCIVQNMENYREKVYCIFAGYENKMDEFLSANPGIRSRISFTVKFDDYSNDILNDVFKSIADGNGYKLPKGFEAITDEYFDKLKRSRCTQFGNGREARNLFTNAVQKMAIRIGNSGKLTKYALTHLSISDIREAAKDILDSEIKSSKSNAEKCVGF